MWFQVKNNPEGYVVECYWVDGDYGHWRPLRNFGQRQGDAIEFRGHDLPKFSLSEIERMMKNYNPSILYERIGFGHYIIQKH